ncbi:glycosyltransferase [Candidatus Pacearchaeota archaeon]|nr:glycosyltransferase [Candidatus Pacearchaeota archaeon]
MSKKIALFHPWIKSRGGAERVVLEIIKNSKHKIDLFTWVYDKENTFKEFQKYNVKVIAPKIAQKISRMHLLRGLFLPLSIFSKIKLKDYDLFLISTSGVAEFMTFKNYKKGKTYAYVHTPLREANKKIINWNLENKYPLGIKRYAYIFATKIYKFFEKKAWKKLNVVIFNSNLSLKRAKESNLKLNSKPHIIYPPINFSRFENLKLNKGKYFLYWNRLNPPKRQDLLIEAWKNFSKKNPSYKLIIAGTPENEKYYKKLQKLQKDTKNVEIKTNVSDKEIDSLLANSLASLSLSYSEDFGIIPLEIIASGKPLLATDEGGYVEIINDHPLFHKIKEKHSKKEMIKEIEKELNNFIKKKQKKTQKKIKIKNFVKEIDKILEK